MRTLLGMWWPQMVSSVCWDAASKLGKYQTDHYSNIFLWTFHIQNGFKDYYDGDITLEGKQYYNYFDLDLHEFFIN